MPTFGNLHISQQDATVTCERHITHKHACALKSPSFLNTTSQAALQVSTQQSALKENVLDIKYKHDFST